MQYEHEQNNIQIKNQQFMNPQILSFSDLIVQKENNPPILIDDHQ
jgi:hypothetical protein